MNTKKGMPPIPKLQRSLKGAGSEPELEEPVEKRAENIDEAGDRANVWQNTSNRVDRR